LANRVNGEGGYGAPDSLTGKYIRLTADIDLSAYSTGEGWTPIGNISIVTFAGTFDGGGFEVSGLYINSSVSNGSYYGLFGYMMQGGTILNLGVAGSIRITRTTGGVICVGGIVGRVEGALQNISNCYNRATIVVESAGSSVGGIVGQSASISISDSYNTGTISVQQGIGEVYVGGIIGNCGAVAFLRNVHNDGTVTASGDSGVAGGIIGRGSNIMTISDSYNTGSVMINSTGDTNYAGGIIGRSKAGCDISISYNTGSVMINSTGSNNYAGGIVGYAETANMIRDSYNTGIVRVDASESLNAGGIVGGINGSNNISGSYNTGAVSGRGNNAIRVGGITGYFFKDSNTITGSYNTGAVSAECQNSIYAGGIMGLYSGGNCSVIGDSYNIGDVRANGTGSIIYAGGIMGGVGFPISKSAVSGSYSAGAVAASGTSGVYTGGIAGLSGSDTDISGSYYNKDNYTGDAVGSGANPVYAAGLETAAMTGDGALTAMSGLSGEFCKRAADLANGIVYYPELRIFRDSSNPVIADASRISVAIGQSFALRTPKDIYKIIYGYQGATGGNERRFDLVEAEHDSALAVPAITGYRFSGWFDEGGAQYTGENGAGTPVTSDKILYARWEIENYAIKYETDGGANDDNPTSYTINDTVSLAPARRTGYTFGGWFSDAGFDRVTLGIAAGSAESKTFYAKWIVNTYTVSYNANGGEGATALSGKYDYGESYTLSENGYTRAGYSFTGWNTASDGSGSTYKAGDEVSSLTDINGGVMTLYAQWSGAEAGGIIGGDTGADADDIVGGIGGGAGFDWTTLLLIGINLLLLLVAIILHRMKKEKGTIAAAVEMPEQAQAAIAAPATMQAALPAPQAAEAIAPEMQERSGRVGTGNITVNLYGAGAPGAFQGGAGAAYATYDLNGQSDPCYQNNLNAQNAYCRYTQHEGGAYRQYCLPEASYGTYNPRNPYAKNGRR
jgi:uncharacterized repeat protein (TIGR02543 family)